MESRWQRLGRLVDSERARRRLSWAALARYAGISPRTLYEVHKGERTSYDAETLARLESALWWQPGSVDLVLAGRRPQRIPDPDLARVQHAWPDLPPAVRRVLADVAELHRL